MIGCHRLCYQVQVQRAATSISITRSEKANVNWAIWTVVASTVLSGFFAAASYSMRGMRRATLEERLGDSPRSRRILGLLDRRGTSLRLTSSYGRSLANITLVVAMASLMHASAGGPGRVIAAVAAAAILIAIFGVAIPHALARHAGEKVLLSSVYPVLALRYALWPLMVAMESLDTPVRRLLGSPAEEDEQIETAKQEIMQAASEGQAEGAVNAEEVEMIQSVIGFGDTEAAEIMTPRTDVFALPENTSWAEACKRVTEAGHTRVPVYEVDLDNIIGVLYAKDLLRFTGDQKPSGLRGLMRKPFFIPESKPLNELLAEFRSRKVHLAIVLDEYGGTAGLVTIEDVLEEIVGEIADEYDPTATPLMRKTDEQTAEVEGRMYVDDLNEAMGLDVPEDEGYDTVAGMVFSELGYIPPVGEVLETHGARFTVLAADERRIIRLRVQTLRAGEGEQD